MKNLYTTHPHFVRCIIPNELKQPGKQDRMSYPNSVHHPVDKVCSDTRNQRMRNLPFSARKTTLTMHEIYQPFL